MLSSFENIDSPAWIIDENAIDTKMGVVDFIKKKTGCKVLYSVKALLIKDILSRMLPHVDGFSASSLFEAKAASDILGSSGILSVVSPGLRPDEFEVLSKTCSHVIFNSLSQVSHLTKRNKNTKYGIRINPEKSYLKDERYNPCCKNSRLGTPLKQADASSLNGISGVHFHSNSASTTFIPLLETVKHLSKEMGNILEKMEWINLGGGYLFEDSMDYTPLFEAIHFLKDKYQLDVLIEPGTALVEDAISLVTTVIDLFKVGEKNYAILDTTVNHMPEFFEYRDLGERLSILTENPTGKYAYFLGGSSCLAGDIFGEYRFDEPLKIGSRIVCKAMGAYTLVKSHMFNGINLPSIYLYSKESGLRKKRHFQYEDFLSRIGEKF